MRSIETLFVPGSPSIGGGQWLAALLLAVLLHSLFLIALRSPLSVDDGAVRPGDDGIRIGLKALMTPPDRRLPSSPQPQSEPEPVPPPEPAAKPEPRSELRPLPAPQPIAKPQPQTFPAPVPRPMPEPEQMPADSGVPELEAAPAAASAEAVKQQPPAINEPGQGGGDPELEASYADRLRSRLERFKQYPAAAQRRGQQDVVWLQFAIDADGKLLSYRITEPSRYRVLNDAVEKMIHRASPMPPVPEEIRNGKTRFVYTIPVQFSISR